MNPMLSLRHITQRLKNPKYLTAIAAIGLFAFVGGVYLLRSSQAAAPFVSAEAEQGIVNSPASVVEDASASGGKALKFGAGQTPGASTLPFTLATTAALRASGKKVFAHYWPPMPVSIDNQDPASDYYARNYLNIHGERDKYLATGGYLRDRPMTRPPLVCPIAGEPNCTAGNGTSVCPSPGLTPTWRLADMKAEIRRAARAGLDGFTLDIIGHPTSGDVQVCQNPLNMLQAASEVDPGFAIVLMPDMSGGLSTLSPNALADWFAKLASYPSAYHLPDGRLVLAPFYPEKVHNAAWWADFLALLKSKHDINVAFVPVFNTNSTVGMNNFNSISYGFSNWGNRSPATNQNLAPNMADAHNRGKIWMQSVSLQDVRVYSSTYDEALNSENWRTTWKAAIAGADWVQIPTWNDYSEETNVSPSPHTGWSPLDIGAYYLTRFKTGMYPAITNDVIYVAHRVQFAAATPTNTPGYTNFMKLRPGSSPARDAVEILSYLKAPANITVKVGSTTQTYAAPAGEYVKTIPLQLGSISAAAERSGNIVAQIASPFTVQASFMQQDLQYHFASSARAGGIGNYEGTQ